MIHKYKPEGMSPNNFSNYQNQIHLFIDLRNIISNINPKEVLKDQINFSSDLVEIKKEIQNQN